MPYIISDHQQLLDYLQQLTEDWDSHQRLGDVLVRQGKISQEQLQAALAVQEDDASAGRLGQILLKEKLVDHKDLAGALGEQLGIAQVNLETFQIDPEAVLLLPESLARERKVLPLLVQGEMLVVATPTPSDFRLLHLLGFVSGKQVEAIQASEEQMHMAFNRFYGAEAALQLPENEPEEPELTPEAHGALCRQLDT